MITNASSRGLTVSLKASEARGAAQLEETTLYSNSYALVVGIDNYVDGWPRLSNAVADSNKIALALSQRGFDVTQLNNLDGRDLEDALEDFFIDKGADPEARLFVWYAGHGHTMDGEGFLVPADGVLPSDRKQFLRRATSLRRFSEFVRLAESKHVFTVFDSCFAGTIFNVARSAPPPAITRVTTKPVRQFLSSGDAGQTVSDDGTFAQLFVEALAGERRADLNQDGYLTAEEIGSFLTNKISNYTNNKQIPRHGKLRDPKFDQGDFVFKSHMPVSETVRAINQTSLKKTISDDQPGANFSLDDLSLDGDRWIKYQNNMSSALKQIQVFEQTHSEAAERPLVSAAWEKLLTAFGQDNPYSKDDEKIRLTAKQRIDALNRHIVTGDKVKIQSSTREAEKILPLIKVQARYPQRMLSRGMRGWVIVEFTVTKNGSVENVKVVENCAWDLSSDCADSPHSGFDKAAINAASKYKFKPMVVAGKRVSVAGVRTRVNFSLQ